mgnify:FL=1
MNLQEEKMNDNINIGNLYQTLLNKKRSVLIILLASVVLSSLYAFTLPNLYRAQIYIVPPQDKFVQPLNYFATQIAKDSQLVLKQQYIYFDFMKNAQSRQFQRKFFFDNNIYDYFDADPEEAFDVSFNEMLRFSLESKYVSRDIRQEDFFNVSFLHSDPNLAAKWLNDYVQMVERETSRRIVDGVNTSIENYRKKIQSAIDSHKNQAKQIRADNITRLKEALLIAEELDIIKPSNANLTNQTIIMDNSTVSGPTQITEMPLYLFGTDALKTQIDILQNRVSDDPFIPNLRSLEAELNTTSLVKVNYSDVRVAEIDQKALAPTRKYSPRRSLILIVGLFFGIVVSFFYILIAHTKK